MAGSRKTARKMTWRELLGQQIFQGIRAAGQSNPSPQYLQSQAVAQFAWPMVRPALEVVRTGFTSKLTKQPAASAWYKANYAAIIGASTAPSISPVPADWIFTKGTMTPTPYTTAAVASAGAKTVTIHFQAGNADITQANTDFPLVVIYNADQQKTIGIAFGPGSNNRTTLAGTLIVNTPTGFMAVGDEIHIYLGWYGAPTTPNAGTSSTSVEESVTAVA